MRKRIVFAALVAWLCTACASTSRHVGGYYDRVNDPWSLTNTLGDDDPLNDPSPSTVQLLEDRVEDDRVCAGVSCP